MMGLQPGLSENFVYNNDDFFINSNLSTSDFVSPIFGTVLRFQPELRVTSIEFPGDQPGEWPALKYSNWLLSRRFGERARAYITHGASPILLRVSDGSKKNSCPSRLSPVTRSMSKPLLLEARLIWAEEFASNALHRFRGQGRDAATHFLAHHLIIERHREALLWSFFVLRLDTDGDGLYDPAELRNAWIEMGVGLWARNRKVDVGMPIRATLGPESASNSLRRVGFPVPLGTSYEFTSHDGYPFLQLSPAVHRPRPPPGGMRGGGPIRPAAQHENWPSFVPNNETEYRFGNAKYPACKMDLNACLYGMEMEAQEGVNAEEVFQTFAFGNVQCGDCRE